MKVFFLFTLFIGIAFFGRSQSFEFWNAVGAKYKISDRVTLVGSFTDRINNRGVKALFPELTTKFKIVKWASVSIDYRYVSKKENNGNYLGVNRFNFNARFKNSFKRLKYSCRFRYQMSSGGSPTQGYESDFDEAFRFKPALTYNIKKSIFEPSFGIDFFYNPTHGVYGKRFDKMRYSIGSSIDLGGPHALDVSVKLDQKFNSSSNGNKLIFALAYELDLNKFLKGKSKSAL